MNSKRSPHRVRGVDAEGLCPCHGKEYMNTGGRYAICSVLHGKLVARFTQRERVFLRQRRWRKTYPLAVLTKRVRWRLTWRIAGHDGLFVRGKQPVGEGDATVGSEVIALIECNSGVRLVRFSPWPSTKEEEPTPCDATT